MTDSVAPVAPETTPTVAPVAIPEAAPVPQQDSSAATPAPAEQAKSPTLLGGDIDSPQPDKSPDANPAEPKPAEIAPDPQPAEPVESPKEEASQSDEPAPLPAYEAFTLPEGIALDGVKLSEFTKDLGELQNMTKADQAVMQQFGQKLVERHVAEVQEAVKRVTDHMTTSWEKQQNDWKTALESDPELGGNRIETTKREVNTALARALSSEQRKEFAAFMNEYGVGNHPVLARAFASLGRLIATYESETSRPLAATKPEAQPMSKVDKRYGKL